MPTPEQEAREDINRRLVAAGWKIQDRNQLNLSAGLGVAIREYPMTSGPVDYLLMVDRRAAGVIEAKPKGTTLSGVAEQSGRYISGIPETLPHVSNPLPFAYESTGVETLFRDLRDPDPRSRRVFSFHKPETLQDWLVKNATLRTRLRQLPPLITTGLRGCQIEAVTNLEQSFAADRPRALIQMATGSGKTFTAITFIYRLIKHADASRVLFLVDRNNLGRQTWREFKNYETPDDGRKFTELYNVQHMRSNTLDSVSKVCITTIQRLFSMLSGEPEFDESLEEQSVFSLVGESAPPREVIYNSALPIETFDFIVTDECHRSIYHLWRQVLEYFDSYLIGLTATPSMQTLGFFNRNLVMEYNHERAVADGVNVGYDTYRIKTKITEAGSTVDAGLYVDKRDKRTRAVRWEQLDEDLTYDPNQLDRSVVAADQIRTVIRTFRDKLFTEIFPGRTEVPKTLIFAKDDSHAEDIVNIVREEFGRGNEFCKKITYRTTGEAPSVIEASFRNSYYPRIAVSVDMLSTGTDIRPLECLLFMRDVRSRVYFEQMKGRGTRVITPSDLEAVTPDATAKTHFIIVDAVGVCESDKTDTRPLEREPTVSYANLINRVAIGNRDKDTLSSLANRLARQARQLSKQDEDEIKAVSGGKSMQQLVNGLLDAIDPDKHEEAAQIQFQNPEPSPEQIETARTAVVESACRPFDNPNLRNKLLELKQRNEQTIDTVSQDEVLLAGFEAAAQEKAREVVQSFKQFIEANKDELTALQIFYNLPYGRRHLTYDSVKQLAEALTRPPYQLSTENVWRAYEILEARKVHKLGPQKLLTNIVSLVRFAVGEADVLEPFPETVSARFDRWLTEQRAAGHTFSEEQVEWLVMIRDHVAASLKIEVDDFEYTPFQAHGGVVKAAQVFGKELTKVLEEINEVLAA